MLDRLITSHRDVAAILLSMLSMRDVGRVSRCSRPVRKALHQDHQALDRCYDFCRAVCRRFGNLKFPFMMTSGDSYTNVAHYPFRFAVSHSRSSDSVISSLARDVKAFDLCRWSEVSTPVTFDIIKHAMWTKKKWHLETLFKHHGKYCLMVGVNKRGEVVKDMTEVTSGVRIEVHLSPPLVHRHSLRECGLLGWLWGRCNRDELTPTARVWVLGGSNLYLRDV